MESAVGTITSDLIARADKRRMAHLWLGLWDAVIVGGNKVPYVAARYRRILDVRAGDLIVETSTLHRLVLHDPDLLDSRWDGQFIRFLRTDREQGLDFETYQVCANPDGSEFRWTNADLRAVPDGTW